MRVSKAAQLLRTPRRALHPRASRAFSATTRRLVVKPFILADIGEGIREVQIIQWFVQPGARVEQFDKLCEVQSDKASVEITSRFDGVIKKLHYEADDMAYVGKALLDIDIQGELSAEDEAATKTAEEKEAEQPEQEQSEQEEGQGESEQDTKSATTEQKKEQSQQSQQPSKPAPASSGKHAALATPAVRHLCKEHDLDIVDIPGTGKDGRVLKEDVQNYISSRSSESSSTQDAAQASTAASEPTAEDRTVSLTPIQSAMLKTMTRSLSIPHFLYSDTLDMTSLTSIRRGLNEAKKDKGDKLSALPFFLKAVSVALSEYPILNARLDTTTNPQKPHLVYRGAHNIGIAVDTPNGLLVPVVKNVQRLSITAIGAEAKRLAALAQEGKLTSADLTGGTFSVSNVGSIGGGVVSPVIVEGQMGIVGVGRSKPVPAFDDHGNVVRREECTVSWSADHRVIDGATVARAAALVKELLEDPGQMVVRLR